MEAQVLLVGLSFVVCAIFAACFSLAAKKIRSENICFLLSSLSVVLSFIFGAGLFTFFFWDPYDFVSDIQFNQYLIFLFSLLLIIFSFFSKIRFSTEVSVLLAASLNVFVANFSVSFLPTQPLLVNQLLTVFVFWVFALGFRTTTPVNSLPQIESMTICCGLLFLYLFGVAPFVLGLNTAGLLGALIISYFHNKSLSISYQNAPLIGFVLGWFGLLAYQEYIGFCFIIFAMLYLEELFVCAARKLSFLPQYKVFTHNSVIFQTLNEGIPSVTLIKSIFNICLLSLVFGFFQVFSDSAASLVAFSAVLTAWMLYRLCSWQQPDKSLSETNKEVISQLKQGFSKIMSTDKSKTNQDKKP